MLWLFMAQSLARWVTQSAQRKIVSVVDEAELLDHGPPLALFAVDVLHVFRRRRDDRITAGIEQSLLHVFRTHILRSSRLSRSMIGCGLPAGATSP